MIFYSLLLLCLTNVINVHSQHLCERVEIVFVVDSSSSTNGTFYQNDIKDFVHKVSSSFSFKDDVQAGSTSHARFAVASYGDSYHFKFKFLRDETRKAWSDTVDSHFVYSDLGDGVASNGMALAQQIISSSSVDMNRVVVLLTSVVTTADVNQAATRWVHDMSSVVFGVGFPDTTGVNHVSQDTSIMVEMAQNRSDWVYKTVAEALLPTTGITSKIVEAYPCNTVQCTGYIFAMEDTYQTNSSLQMYMNNVVKVINQLPSASNGFQFLVFDDSEVELFPFESAAGAIDRINHFWFEPVPSPSAPKLDILLAEVDRVIARKEFNNFALVLLSETDYLTDQVFLESTANRLARSSAQVFVVDMSIDPKDQGKTFNTITKNQNSHIIKGAGLSEAQLYTEMQKTLIPALTGLTC